MEALVPHADKHFWERWRILSAILLLAPIRRGDLPGYDDARWAVIAKDFAHTHHWFDLRYDGGAALEHPPLFSWIQADAFFLAFDLSDPVAKPAGRALRARSDSAGLLAGPQVDWRFFRRVAGHVCDGDDSLFPEILLARHDGRAVYSLRAVRGLCVGPG